MNASEINERIEKLEAWMHSQHWPADPERKTPPDVGPHDQRHSPTVRERAEQKARQAALNEFRKSPALVAIQELEKRLFDLEKKLNDLHGEGGIRVTGSVIELIPQQVRTPGGTTGGNTLRFRVCVGGEARDVDITDAQLVPL